jgi:hypothetical protein
MSRKNRTAQDVPGLNGARTLARQAIARLKPVAAQVKPAAAQVKPLAKSTGAAARRQVHKTRAWAAPQVERTGQVLQDSVAPKVSALLSSAAQRLEPTKPRRPRWRKPVGIATVTASAGAAAAFIRNRMKPGATTRATPAHDMTTPAAPANDATTPADDATTPATPADDATTPATPADDATTPAGPDDVVSADA